MTRVNFKGLNITEIMNGKLHWSEDNNVLHIEKRTNLCTVLGPGLRSVIWVRGCPFRCPGCVSPELWPFEGGVTETIEDLSKELISLPNIEGVTFSGGEPMMQAKALCSLIDKMHSQRELSFVCFTGFYLEQIITEGTVAQKQLLERLDLLIDGPYLEERHSDLKWLGSDNQRIHFLTDRYLHIKPTLSERGNWVEFEFNNDGRFHWMGIPPRGFRKVLLEQFKRLGIET
jgi:anaerobic ribonucleoside-triphosphate reductase activating protein